jgi:prepilin-type N-terminal cleavage/methylation domain-containing protein
MKPSGFAGRFKSGLEGFTLLELLVSMVVLALVMGILLQVVNGILKTTQMHSQQMDSVGAARRAMDILSMDLSKAVVGEYSTVLVGNQNLAMVSERRGTNSTDHRFLGVTYSLNNYQIVRTYRSVSFYEADLLTAAQMISGAANSTLADGILGWNIRVMTSSGPRNAADSSTPNFATNIYNGLTVPNGWKALITASSAFASSFTNKAQGLDVWIAAVDEQNSLLLKDSQKLDAVRQALQNDPANWRSEIDKLEMPLPAKASIQILHKTISLP